MKTDFQLLIIFPSSFSLHLLLLPQKKMIEKRPEYMMIHVLYFKEYLTLQKKYLNGWFYFT